MNDEEAVSPVIAVILMVAITVVLAATVFVLVNELGQDVGESGPNLGLTTASGTDSEGWNVRITSATQTAGLSEYTVILTHPGGTDSQSLADWDGTGTQQVDASDYYLAFTDVGGAGDLGVGSRLTLTYETVAGTPETIPAGDHTLELVHRPTSTSSGSIERPF